MSSRIIACICLLLVGLTALAFSPVVANDFIDLDDGLYVTENRHVLEGLSIGNASWAWTTFHAGLWLPLTWLSLQLDVSVFGPGAWGFHVTNLALHIANVLLLFWTIR